MGARCSPLLTDLHGPAGARGDLSGLEKGVLGVLFAGKWCQPCDEFVDILKRCYQQVRSRGEEFEIVFVSADKVQEDFDRMVEDMPWWSIAFGDFLKLIVLTGLPSEFRGCSGADLNIRDYNILFSGAQSVALERGHLETVVSRHFSKPEA